LYLYLTLYGCFYRRIRRPYLQSESRSLLSGKSTPQPGGPESLEDGRPSKIFVMPLGTGGFGATRSKLPPSSAEAAFLARWATWSEERRRPAVEEIEGMMQASVLGVPA